MTRTRIGLVVGGCAVVVYLGALVNRFAFDDQAIILVNPLVHSWAGVWQAFTHSYWPANFGGEFYRPLPIVAYTVDAQVGHGAAWLFHLVNLLWHGGVSVLVALLARRWRGDAAGLIAGLLFAVHPVHVEAVANLVGRAELMAAFFVLASVYAAVIRRSVGWSTAALIAGILCKENAAVVPGLVIWAWLLGLDRPSRGRMVAFLASWVVAIAVCFWIRWVVLHGYMGRGDLPALVGANALTVRLTGVAELTDAARLLVFPLHLRVDYSPNERTSVSSPFDARFIAGLASLAVLLILIFLAWRRGWKEEAFGLGWIAIAYLPASNLLVPIGVLMAERTLYLPSVGLALAVGVRLGTLRPSSYRPIVAVLVILGAIRTAWRVPVWRDDNSVTLSILNDSPNSYVGPQFTASILLRAGQASHALQYYRDAHAVFAYDPRSILGAADAALALGNRAQADSFFAMADVLCGKCRMHYLTEAEVARARGDTAAAAALLARLQWLDRVR